MEEEQILEQQPDQNSVEISINAKGKYSGKIKVYAKTSEEAMNDALQKAKQLEELIKVKNDESSNDNS